MLPRALTNPLRLMSLAVKLTLPSVAVTRAPAMVPPAASTTPVPAV